MKTFDFDAFGTNPKPQVTTANLLDTDEPPK